jgi:hypothetical protein
MVAAETPLLVEGRKRPTECAIVVALSALVITKPRRLLFETQ